MCVFCRWCEQEKAITMWCVSFVEMSARADVLFFHVRFVFISSAMLRYIFFGRSDLFLPHTHYLATWKSDTISVTFWHCVNCQVEKKSSSVPSSILLDTASRSHTHSHTAQEKRIQFFAFVSNCVTCTQCTITILSNQMQLFGIFFLAVPIFRFRMRHNTNTRKSLENLSIISILCVCVTFYDISLPFQSHFIPNTNELFFFGMIDLNAI